MIDEGYIKYRCDWVKEAIAQSLLQKIGPETLADLTAYRDALYRLNFIGEYPDGIGFGNISQRLPYSRLTTVDARLSERSEEGLAGGVGNGGESLGWEDFSGAHPTGSSLPFVITGTQTGNLSTLSAADYALVTAFNPEQNTLTCKGLRKASSESLTHGVIYASQLAINAVIHVHSPQLWKRLLHQVPTTRADIPYGTPEMAAETQRLFRESPLLHQKIFAMAGHEDGIVTFGENLQTAYRVLINWSLMTGFMTQLDSESALQLPYQLA